MENSPKINLVLGASPNSERYSYMATQRLASHGYEVIAFGNKSGKIGEIPIITDVDQLPAVVDTITLYLNPKRQKAFYSLILDKKPRRIIFNPGTENPELIDLAKNQGIHAEIACTLVLLSTSQY